MSANEESGIAASAATPSRTSADVLLDLAERCEQATGPDRELDLAIELYLEGGEYDYPADNWPKDAPYYSASLDAAMSLVPEGREWSVRHCELPDGTWAAISRIGEQGCGLNTSAATPALALAAASLRSLSGKRSSTDGEGR